LLDAEDMLVEPYPDKLSVATYCIEIRRRWDALTNQFGVPAVAIAGASAVAVGETASSAIAESSLLAKAVETLKAETIHQQHLISSLKAELSAVREQIAAKVSHASARATPSPDVKRRDEMAEKENRHQQELMRVEIDAHLRTIARLRDQLTEQKQKTGQKQSSGGFVTSVVCFLVGFSVGALVVYLR
jgi:L-2-hydroxyglutarate oxidase LhgO